MGNWGEETLWGYTYELYGPLPITGDKGVFLYRGFLPGTPGPGTNSPKNASCHFPYFQSILMGVGLGMGVPLLGTPWDFSQTPWCEWKGANELAVPKIRPRKFHNTERFGATPPGFQAYRRYLETNSKRTWKMMVGRHLFGKASWQVLVLGSVFGFIKDQYVLPSLQTFAEIASHLEESIFFSSWKIYSNMF